MNLAITLQDGRTSYVKVPEGSTAEATLDALANRHHPFTSEWVKTTTGEYVRHGFIVAIRPGRT